VVPVFGGVGLSFLCGVASPDSGRVANPDSGGLASPVISGVIFPDSGGLASPIIGGVASLSVVKWLPLFWLRVLIGREASSVIGRVTCPLFGRVSYTDIGTKRIACPILNLVVFHLFFQVTYSLVRQSDLGFVWKSDLSLVQEWPPICS